MYVCVYAGYCCCCLNEKSKKSRTELGVSQGMLQAPEQYFCMCSNIKKNVSVTTCVLSFAYILIDILLMVNSLKKFSSFNYIYKYLDINIIVNVDTPFFKIFNLLYAYEINAQNFFYSLLFVFQLQYICADWRDKMPERKCFLAVFLAAATLSLVSESNPDCIY